MIIFDDYELQPSQNAETSAPWYQATINLKDSLTSPHLGARGVERSQLRYRVGEYRKTSRNSLAPSRDYLSSDWLDGIDLRQMFPIEVILISRS
jgi:hypothetical protein